MSSNSEPESPKGRCDTVKVDDAMDPLWEDAPRELLAAIVDASDDAIVSKSLDGTILSWNSGAERLFGYTAEEAIGQSINLIIPEHLRAEEKSILARLSRGERIDHFETVRVTRDGRKISISLTISPVRNASGKIVGASKVARDITERKQTQMALDASEERFRDLANNIDQFAWTCNELGYATWYNQRWYEYTGTTFEQMQGRGWRAVHHPDHVDRVEESIMRGVRTEEPWEETFPLRGKDGTYRWFLSRAIPIRDAEGHVIRWFGTNTDITEHRELEMSLRKADRRKDEFLATLSHELRNPLAAISSSLEVLNQADEDPELFHRARDAIGRQTSHLVRLVDDLLDVSRITRDRIELQRSAVDLEPMLRHAIDVCLPFTEKYGQTFEYDVPDVPVMLDADPVRLAQILNNLLNNACNFSPLGGTIRLTATLEGDRVRISVKDEGVGISPEQLEDIFDMFAQAHRSSERLTGGLGVGLTLVKRLVELHGGTISARSEGIGQGSEFIVELPIASAAQEAVPAADTSAAGDKVTALRVLVVDDNIDNAESMSMLLSLNGHQTRVAYDGMTALEMAEEFQPQAVFLDIGLPKMNGLEVCRRMRGESWGRAMQIVAVTGWGQEADRQRSAEAGFDQHLVKPVEYSDLEQVLAVAGTGTSDAR